MQILAFDHPYTNSHILNTLLMKWSSGLFGNNELALRLPNILSFLLYTFSSYGLLSMLKKQMLVIPSFLLMISNPFLLDFFALARGYGLAISLITTSIYFYAKYIHDSNRKNFLLSLIFAGISVMANFGALYYLTILIALHQLISIIKYRINKPDTKLTKYLFQNNLITIGFLAIYGLVMYEAFRRFSGLKMDFGGSKSIWEDVIVSLINSMKYSTRIAGFQTFFQALVIIAVVVALSFWGYFIIRGKKKDMMSYLILLFIHLTLSGILVQIYLMHQLRGTPYPTDRIALFLVPLFWLSVIFLIDGFNKKWTVFPIIIIGPFLLLHSTLSLNIYSYDFWKFDASSKKMLNKLDAEVKDKNKYVQLGISWYFEPALNYYRIKDKITWLQPLTRNRFKPTDDYVYVHWEDKEFVNDSSIYVLIEDYTESRSSLYRVKHE